VRKGESEKEWYVFLKCGKVWEKEGRTGWEWEGMGSVHKTTKRAGPSLWIFYILSLYLQRLTYVIETRGKEK